MIAEVFPRLVQFTALQPRPYLFPRAGSVAEGARPDCAEDSVQVAPSEGLCFILHLISCNRGEFFFLQVTSFAIVLLRQIVAWHFEEIVPFIVVSMSA